MSTKHWVELGDNEGVLSTWDFPTEQEARDFLRNQLALNGRAVKKGRYISPEQMATEKAIRLAKDRSQQR